MFFVDKYRPHTKKNSKFHKEILDMLEIMSKDRAIPHIIMYGPDGAGKRTIINIFLGMLFGPNAHNTKDIPYEIVSCGGKKTTEKVRQSNYHIEINPKSTNYDRYLIHDIVKGYAKSKSLNTIFEKNKQFKLVLINNVDKLSFCAQAALRRTMERYNDKCRFIMWCSSLSKVIDPLQSRCICQRVPAPSDNELFRYIFEISIKENIILKLEDYSTIVSKSNGNIKKALWELNFKKFGYDLDTKYLNTIDQIASLLPHAKIENIKEIRDLYFDLMITNYSGSTLLRDIVDRLYSSPNLTKETKQKIVSKNADTEYRLMKGRRDIIHLDAFTISVMQYINNQDQEQEERKNNIKKIK